MRATVFLLLICLGVPAAILAHFLRDAGNPYSLSDVTAESVPTFTEIDFPYTHEYDSGSSLPFTASALIDIDGDGVEEVFIGGGRNQSDGLLGLRIKRGSGSDGLDFTNISAGRGLAKARGDASYGALAIDMNSDGQSDLLVARQSGLYLYLNRRGLFDRHKLDIPFNARSVPLSIAAADIDRDGHIDFYLSCYIKNALVEGQTIFNDPDYGATSLMLLNNGDNTFRDITRESGLEYLHNTFQAVFIDLDADGKQDLVVAHDTGRVRTWKNLGGNRFADMPNPSSDEYGYPMGIGVGDINNDALPDLFFSNIGSTLPAFIVRGDLRDDQRLNKKWRLFLNRGDFQFTDVAESAGVADFEFAWGAVIEDINLDGLKDLIVAENYIKLLPHHIPQLRLPGRMLLQRPQGRFVAVEQRAGVVNPHFAITPLVSDFNDDGYPDLVYVNLGGRSRAFISEGGNNRYIKVRLQNDVRSLGAVVTVETGNGSRYTQYITHGEGLCSGQSPVLTFGLGRAERIARLSIRYMGEEKPRVLLDPPIDTTIEI